jgi:hypothetical protein
VAPAVGEFGEAMDEEDKRAGLVWRVAGFEDMEVQAMWGSIDETGGYA